MEGPRDPEDDGLPLGVYAAMVCLGVLIAGIVLELGQALGLLVGPFPIDGAVPGMDRATVLGSIAIGGGLILGVAALAAIVGLALRRSWGWTASLITAGIVLALDLGWWLDGHPRYMGMLLASILVLYLNQRDVRAIYQEGEG